MTTAIIVWLVLSVPASLFIAKFCALSNSAPTPEAKHEQKQAEHQLHLLHS
jgi:hypothetical protein